MPLCFEPDLRKFDFGKKRVFEIAYLCQTSQKTSLHITGGIKIISWSGPRIIQHLLNLTLQQLNQAPDVQKVDNAIHWMVQLVCLILICWVVIYPVVSAI